MPFLHASCVEWGSDGILICGKSGAGKSDLCLRLIDSGAKLVADDQTEIKNESGRLTAICPASLQGMLEIRGIGIVRKPFIPKTEIKLKLDLRTDEKIDRMPLPATEVLEGINIPVFTLDPFEASALPKIKTYLKILNGTEKVIL